MKTIIYTALLGILFLGCDRATNVDVPSDNALPPITQSGANTFGCILNGVVFVPNKAIGSTVVEKPLYVAGYYDNTDNWSRKIVGLRGRDVRNLLSINVYIYKIYVNGIGDYALGSAPYFSNDPNPPFNSFLYCRAVSPSTNQYRDYGSFDNSGIIKVTYLSADKFIMSGTFTGKLKDLDGDEIIEVIDGRFDINLKTL